MYRADLAHPPQVVAQQVNDHEVLGPVLLARTQAPRQVPVFLSRPSPRPCSLDRTRVHSPPVQPQEALRRGAEDAQTSKGKVCAVRHSRYFPQPLVEAPRVSLPNAFQTVREVGLVNLPRADVLSGAPHRAHVSVSADVRAHNSLSCCLGPHSAPACFPRPLVQQPQHLLAAHNRLLKSTLRQRSRYQPAPAELVVIAEHPVVESDADIGQAQVVHGGRRDTLKVATEVVPEVTSYAPLKRRQPGYRLLTVPLKQVLQYVPGVACECSSPSRTRYLYLAPTAGESQERVSCEVRVAACLAPREAAVEQYETGESTQLGRRIHRRPTNLHRQSGCDTERSLFDNLHQVTRYAVRGRRLVHPVSPSLRGISYVLHNGPESWPRSELSLSEAKE